MKKAIFLFTGLLATAAFAGMNNVVVTFSTQGPDKYADGSTVLDGECYALVWTPNGSTFGGFKADGTLVSDTDKLIVVAGVAKGERCPTTLFEISAADAEQYKNGKFALYLLDTRIMTAEGKPVAGGAGVFAAGAAGVAVNAAGAAGTAVAGGASEGSIGGGTVVLANIGTYTEVASPVIKAIDVTGANVKLTVEGMESDKTTAYYVVPGSTPSNFLAPAKTQRKGDNMLQVKKVAGENFFKVIGVRRFK